MKRVLKIFSSVLLIVVTFANSGLFYYSLQHRANDASAGSSINLAPKPTQTVASSKQRSVGASEQGKFLADGHYAFASLDTSRIDTGGKGGLVLASYADSGSNFVLATRGVNSIDDSIVTAGWHTKVLADDPLWAPGACSAKPTLLLQGRYIFIDDGKTRPDDKYNSYLVFDMQTGKYNYFGGDSFTDKQAVHENIMFATDENDQLVFYIDQSDSDGPLAGSTTYKHDSNHAANYIIRRVIDPATMKYKDFKIPFTAPKSGTAVTITDYYTLSFYGDATSQIDDNKVALHYVSETHNLTAEGRVDNNAIALHTITPDIGVPAAGINNGPFDTALEKQLNEPLSKVLPTFIAGQPVDPTAYTTNFSLNPIGVHGQTKFIVAASRTGDYAETPAIVDPDGVVHPLTDKDVLKRGSYVPLGVF